MNEKEILMEIGRNICAERNRARLSQEALAEKISMNVRNLGRIERGESNAKITNIIAIMKVLNIPFEAIYKDTE
jgi:transcriptional regulator with XRE-family HTH domain